MTNERPTDAAGNVMLDLSPSLRLNVWLTGDKGTDMIRLADITSAVRGWLSSDDVIRARLMPDRPASPGAQQTAHRPPANGAASAPPRQAAARGGQRSAGTGLWCPEHNVEVLKTAAKFDKDGDRYYHALPESEWYSLDDGRIVKNCNVYERQCERRESRGAAATRLTSGSPPREPDDPDNLPF